ncbi:MAG: hypothetical protein CMB64_07435 [Euryarchaeota archaeon]|nr:hypothetical protein [Euryarchaeota archaeon]|tara:strand:- start:2269 stop:2910 length:642 start_codon:yes stop_codon:yes gene_type:complete
MRAMSFSKSIFYGIKLYFLFSITIGLTFFIDIQRNDISGKIQDSYDYIWYSIDILTIVFPIFTFYVGSKQSNLIKRKTDSGFAAAISSSIGFLMMLYLNWAIILGSLTVAGSLNEPIFEDLENGEFFNNLIWRIIPAILASLLSATTNHKINTKSKIIDSKKSEDAKKDIETSESPWIYSVGTVDEHGFEWIKHNNIQWYRAVNSGDEWKKYN